MLNKLGRYQLREIIGQGGMSTVYRGYDPLMEREVAVKVLIPILARDPVFRSRFLGEIKVVSQLEHPAIVPIYDAGEEEGHLYLVMRLMEGDLRKRLAQGPLPIHEALAVLKRVGSALDAAHKAGIIHRDVKPSNVLFDRYGAAYLTDFGIARLAAMSETLTGAQLMGTPTYMSPEQIEGRKDIDARADEYGLAVLFYHMLAGQPPFQAETPSRVMFLHLTEPPPPIRRFRPDLPAELEAVLERALAKRPEDRYPSVAEFVQAVEQVLTAQPTPTGLEQEMPTLHPGGAEARPETPSPPGTPQTPTPQPPPSAGRRRFWGCLWLFVALAMVAVLGWLFVGGRIPGVTLPWAMEPVAPTLSAALSPGAAATATPPPTATETAVLAAASATPTSSPTPSPTPSPQPTATPTPTATPSPTPRPHLSGGPDIGGADRVAFFWQNRGLWSMATDGSDLRKHIEVSGHPGSLTWLDARRLLYATGNCAYTLDTLTDETQPLLCLDKAPVQQFLLSPDGKWVALLADGTLYLFPYQPETWPNKPISVEDLVQLTQACRYRPQEVTLVQWGLPSTDNYTLVARVRVTWSGKPGDRLMQITFAQCPERVAQARLFPLAPEAIPDFLKLPYILDFTTNGTYTLAITPLVRPEDWGHLYGILNQRTTRLNPVEERCCYRIPRMTVDGQGVFMVYGPADEPPVLGLWALSAWETPTQGWQVLDFWPQDKVPLEEITDWAWRPTP